MNLKFGFFSFVEAIDLYILFFFLLLRRSGVGLAVVNGQLFAVGGFDGTTYLKTIEQYDAEANNWKLCGSMNFRRLGGGVGVVRMPQSDSRVW